MERKTHKSKVTNKSYKKPAFPTYTKNEKGEIVDAKVISKTLDENLNNFSEQTFAGYYFIKDFRSIKDAHKDKPQDFARFLTKLIEMYEGIVLADNGIINRFSGSGALFAYKAGRDPDPRDALVYALNSTLKMRYILNKINRDFGYSFHNAWKIGFGISFGNVVFQEKMVDGAKSYNLSGNCCEAAMGIGQSSGSSQIFIDEQITKKYPGVEERYEVGRARHIPLKGSDHLIKARELVNILGPQAKTLFAEFV